MTQGVVSVKKILILLITLVFVGGSGLGFAFVWANQEMEKQERVEEQQYVLPANHVPLERAIAERMLPQELINGKDGRMPTYQVFIEGVLVGEFDTLEDARTSSVGRNNVFIRLSGRNDAAWDNLPPFFVFDYEHAYTEFEKFEEAVSYARNLPHAYIYHRRDQSLIWSSEASRELPSEHRIWGVPMIYQLPYLARGCEVVSLAMLLNFVGVDVDKFQLAQEIRINPVPAGVINGRIYMGNPRDGFIGNMYTFEEFGYGAYDGPIFELLQKYFPQSAVKLSGAEFEDLLQFVARDIPVWIVTNTRFHYLPPYQFITAHTPEGPIQITWRMHAVTITGFSENRIYFNDPLGNASSANRYQFIRAWQQMGSQAVTLSN